jgi:hypothetical protein
MTTKIFDATARLNDVTALSALLAPMREYPVDDDDSAILRSWYRQGTICIQRAGTPLYAQTNWIQLTLSPHPLWHSREPRSAKGRRSNHLWRLHGVRVIGNEARSTLKHGIQRAGVAPRRRMQPTLQKSVGK